MDISERESESVSCTNLQTDHLDLAATEQIDWDSFVNLDYDPTISTPSTRGFLLSEQAHLQGRHSSATGAVTENLIHDVADMSFFASLDFPSLDEWWSELPGGDRSMDWDSLTGNSITYGNTPRSESNVSTYLERQSPDLEEDGGVKKKRRCMPSRAKGLLTECFERHKENPYIPKEEAQKLAVETGLSLRQVQTFFANARARKLPRPSVEGQGANIPALSEQQGPMERYLSSSSEDDGISEDAVRAAARTMKKPIKPRRSRKANAVSVCDSTASSTSNSSSASIDSLDSRGSRRGRKRQLEPSKNVAKTIFRKPSSPSRKYQCTFCTLDFEQKYDWKRHEESVHFPQKEWVCMPNGPVEDSRCVFCDLEAVDEQHLHLHKCTPCSEAPHAQRAFQRKDKLMQHIKQVHSCQPPKMIKGWCRPVERDVLLLCGFCSLELPDWKTRADHLASHFNNGTSMDMWLPELPGSIWARDQLTINFTKVRFSAIADPQGRVTCENCPSRFRSLPNAILHRRQVHNIFLAADTKVVLSKPTAGHHSQRLINLAQQTSRIEFARMETFSGSSTSEIARSGGRSGPHSNRWPVSSAKSNFNTSASESHINRIFDPPETRGIALAPNVVRKEVLDVDQIVPPRKPVRSPFNQRPTSFLSAGPIARHSSHQISPPGSTSDPTLEQPGPPIEATRNASQQDQDSVGLNTPTQGFLHSLE